MLSCLIPSLASAQTVSQFTNTNASAITDSPGCVSTVTRNFSVGNFNVADVNIGVLLTHRYRSDLRITLSSPTGTTVELINGVGGGANNLNVLFDDEATTGIISHNTNDTAGTVPPYLRTFKPGAALSAFDGQNAQGTWSIVICDSVTGDTGGFVRADLYITQVPASFADLSLTKTVSNINPVVGANLTYTLRVSSAAASNVSATGVTVLDILPSGVNFVSSTGAGSYDSATGVWTVGTLAPNANATISITVTVVAANGSLVTNGAEVRTSSVADVDSIPNNGSTTEDDDAFVSFTVGTARTAGTPPNLICPVGSTLFNWDNVAWTAGSTNNSYPVTGLGTINFNVSMNAGVFLSNPGNGGQSPALQTNFSGGLSPVQLSLVNLVDMTNQDGNSTTVITLPTAVPGAQFRLFDVDYVPNEFADRATVTGMFNGSPVTPTLTNGVANYVIGNTAYGDVNAVNNSADGTVVVTFSSPVDTIVVAYGSHSIGPVNPLQQAISFHDFTFCRPQANVILSKNSVIIDDKVSAANPKALPQAIVRYCVLATNTGSATVTNFTFADVIPLTLTYVAGSLTSGPSCAIVKNVEDDDASGADESDTIGASINGNIITGTSTIMGPDAAFAIRFNATIK